MISDSFNSNSLPLNSLLPHSTPYLVCIFLSSTLVNILLPFNLLPFSSHLESIQASLTLLYYFKNFSIILSLNLNNQFNTPSFPWLMLMELLLVTLDALYQVKISIDFMVRITFWLLNATKSSNSLRSINLLES